MSNSREPQGQPSFSTAHLARRLGVSVPTVQRWVDLGHLKAWKTVGGHRRIDAESAENFIRVQMQQRGGDAAAAAAAEPVVPFSVLVVDDNPDDSDLLCALVEIAVPGARIIVAVSAHSAAHVDKLGGLPAGVTLLAKPVEPTRFVETVNLALDSGG